MQLKQLSTIINIYVWLILAVVKYFFECQISIYHVFRPDAVV